MVRPIEVTVLLTGAQEGNTPLETIANTNDKRVDINVVAWGEVEGEPYGLNIKQLGANSRTDFQGYRDLFYYLKKNKPDLLHVHPIAIGAGATVIARSLGIPVIKTEHNPHTHYGTIKSLCNGIANAFRSAVVSNSQATADSFTRWERKLLDYAGTDDAVIPYGPNIERIDHCRTNIPSPEIQEGTVIGAGGRLVPAKNLLTLIDAMKHISDNHSDVFLAIAGEGSQRSTLEKRVRQHELIDTIHFLGWLDQEKLFAFYDAMDIFAFPSHYEGFGMANAEAMATETPIVCNDIPVLQEVVGDAGILIDATDESELANALERLVENPDLRSELGERARERIQNTYSITRSAEEYVDLYCEVVDC